MWKFRKNIENLIKIKILKKDTLIECPFIFYIKILKVVIKQKMNIFKLELFRKSFVRENVWKLSVGKMNKIFLYTKINWYGKIIDI